MSEFETTDHFLPDAEAIEGPGPDLAPAPEPSHLRQFGETVVGVATPLFAVGAVAAVATMGAFKEAKGGTQTTEKEASPPSGHNHGSQMSGKGGSQTYGPGSR